jgi:myotubularin-related protein 6/7/8
MRSSLQKLLEVCDLPNPTTTQFLSGVDKSDWMKHIKIILETASFMMDAIHEQCINVVVHCSDGWDRTAQTCAIAGVLLDPYYRSIYGYQMLIEKEWLLFGHKFSERCGHTDIDSKEISPIFTQVCLFLFYFLFFLFICYCLSFWIVLGS